MNRKFRIWDWIWVAFALLSAVLLAFAVATPRSVGDTASEAMKIQRRLAGRMSKLEYYENHPQSRLPEDMRQALAETLTGELLVPGRGIRTGAGETDTVLTCLLAAGLIAGGQRGAGEKLLEAVAEAEKAFGLASTYPETGEADCRCAGQYTPAVCAAKLYADSKSR